MEQLRKHLDPAEVYVDVAYLPGEGGGGGTYFAWVATKSDPVRVLKLGDADTINGLVKTFQDHVRDFTRIAKKVGLIEAEKLARIAWRNCPASSSIVWWPRRRTRRAGSSAPTACSGTCRGRRCSCPRRQVRRRGLHLPLRVSGRDVIGPGEAGGGRDGPAWVLADPDLDDLPPAKRGAGARPTTRCCRSAR